MNTVNPVIESLLTRRSIRSFSQKKISRQDLDLILKAGIYAPSGMNRQTMRLTAVTDAEKIQKLAHITGEKLERKDYGFYNANVIIIPSNERGSRWGMEDNACALENIFLAAHSLGIGSVWINQLRDICDEPEIRRLLREWQIPDEHVIYGIAALGYADGKPPLAEKKGIIKIIE